MRKTVIFTLFTLLAIASCTKKSAPTGTASADGPAIFSKNCARCHGAQGVKDERTPNFQTYNIDKQHIINSVTNGKITEGKKEHMPAFKDKLTAAQISAVADLIVSWHKK